MLRATDLQQILVQSNSVERVQQAQQQQSDMQQRYFSVQLSEERKHVKETVKSTEEAEKAKIRDKEEKEKRRKKAKNDDNHGDKKEIERGKKEPDDHEHGGLIDIKV
ncbi:MAG: hypothetical protein ABFD82_10495 [Syntrophaceae bacterium]